jgi:hypothetical protein
MAAQLILPVVLKKNQRSCSDTMKKFKIAENKNLTEK